MKNRPKVSPKPKRRKCLMCGRPFPSEWAGERVCKKCKASSSWRQGGISTGSTWGH